MLTSAKFSALSLITYFLHHQFLRRSDSRGVTDFQYCYSFVLLQSYLFRTTIHTTQVNRIRPTVTVKQESKLTQKLKQSFSCHPSWKRSFSHPTLPGTLSSDIHLPRRAPFKRALFLLCSRVFLTQNVFHLPIKWTTHNVSSVNIFSAPQNILAMYNFLMLCLVRT
jgi:hypothetical protein